MDRIGGRGMGAGVAVLGLALALLWAWWGLSSVRAVQFPFGLDYSEGLIWQQALLVPGPDAYGPIDRFPVIVFQYGPVYHGVVRMLSAVTGLDGLLAGRLLSIGATLAACMLVRAIVLALAPASLSVGRAKVLATLAAVLALAWRPVLLWSAVMRVDIPFIAISLGGLLLAMKAVSRPRLIHGAALLFVLALYTKQTAVSAPSAAFGVLLIYRQRTALAGLATSLVSGLAALGAMEWLTQGGFLRHILLYNINRMFPGNLRGIAANALLHIVPVAVAAFGAASRLGAAQLRRDEAGEHDLRLLMVVAYWVASGIMTFAYLKAGSGSNYFLEWSFATAIMVGVGLMECARRLEAGADSALLRIVPWALVLHVALISAFVGEGLAERERTRDATRQIVEQVARARRPVIGDDMVAILRGGKRVLWEPFIFGELARAGIYDERPFVKMIERRDFGFILTEGQPGDGTYDSRFDSAVDGALRRAYPEEVRLGNFGLHFAPGEVPADLADKRVAPAR